MVDDENPDVPPPETTSGVPWYREEDYPRIRKALRDPDLPEAYADWLRGAEAEERALRAEGKIVARVVIDDLDEFFSWCLDRRLAPEWADRRSEFVLWKLFERWVRE
jgi:hypothetical protein